MSLTKDWVTLIPPPGQGASVARALLDLSPDPRDVRTTNGGNEFLVPPELADAYHASTAPPKAPPKPRARAPKKESD